MVILGAFWYCSTKYHVKPNMYTIVVYDIFGKQVQMEEVRTDFKTQQVAQSFISEYQKSFSGMIANIQSVQKMRLCIAPLSATIHLSRIGRPSDLMTSSQFLEPSLPCGSKKWCEALSFKFL